MRNAENNYKWKWIIYSIKMAAYWPKITLCMDVKCCCVCRFFSWTNHICIALFAPADKSSPAAGQQCLSFHLFPLGSEFSTHSLCFSFLHSFWVILYKILSDLYIYSTWVHRLTCLLALKLQTASSTHLVWAVRKKLHSPQVRVSIETFSQFNAV